MTTIGTVSLIATIDTSKYKKGAADIKSTNSSIQQSTSDAESKGSKSWEKFGNAAKSAAKVVASASVAVAGAASALVVASVKSTADLEQSWGGSEVVFGKYSKEIQKLAQQSAKVMGTSTNEYLETANKMGSLFQGAGFSVKKSMTMSSEAMQRATDVATAMGISTDMALESIAGAAKGNFTMMDNLGVAMNDTTLNAYALEKGIGKTTQQMTNSEKVGLAMQLFMERTAKYAGNYAKENKTLSGSFQTLKGAWGNFMSGVKGSDKQLSDAMLNMANVLGKQLPVIVKNLGENFVRLWGNLKDGSPEFRRFAEGVEGSIRVVQSLIGLIRTWLPLIAGVAAAYAGYRTAVAAANTVMAIHSALIYAMGTRYVVMNGAIIAVKGAVTAATIAQAAWNTVMKLNPIGLVIGAVASLAAGLTALAITTNGSKNATDRLAEARRQAKTATDNLKTAENNLRNAHLNAQTASLAVERAQLNYNSAVAQYGPKSLNAREAANQLKSAQYQLRDANNAVKDATNKKTAAESENAKKQQVVKDAERNKQSEVSRTNQFIQNQSNSLGILTRKLNNLNGRVFSYTISEAQRVVNDGVSSPAAKARARATLKSQGYSTGGFTGRGGKNEEAGIVHKGEYVIPKSAVDQRTGLPKLGSTGGVQVGTIVINRDVDIDLVARKLGIKQLDSRRGIA